MPEVNLKALPLPPHNDTGGFNLVDNDGNPLFYVGLKGYSFPMNETLDAEITEQLCQIINDNGTLKFTREV